MERTGPRDRISHGLNIKYESSSEDDDEEEEERQMRNGILKCMINKTYLRHDWIAALWYMAELADVPLGELQQVRETVGSKK